MTVTQTCVMVPGAHANRLTRIEILHLSMSCGLLSAHACRHTYGEMRAQLSQNPTTHNEIPSGHSPASRSPESSVAHVLSSAVLLHGERVGGGL